MLVLLWACTSHSKATNCPEEIRTQNSNHTDKLEKANYRTHHTNTPALVDVLLAAHPTQLLLTTSSHVLLGHVQLPMAVEPASHQIRC
jgi:hypothetical protein